MAEARCIIKADAGPKYNVLHERHAYGEKACNGLKKELTRATGQQKIIVELRFSTVPMH